jgi:hypothetical protein
MLIEISTLKDIVQTLFYLAMIILGVLSYRQAKKTLFAPIKTEKFKLQLEAIQRVLNQFSNRTEISILNHYDIKNVFQLNFNILIQNYLKTFFPDYIVSKEYSENLNQYAVGAYAPIEELPEGAKEGHSGYAMTYASELIPDEPALKLSKWQNYIYTLVLYTKEYNESLDNLLQLQATPVLPSDLRELINKFIESLEENVGLIRKVLTKISTELPEQMPTVDEGNISTGWAWNEYINSWNDLEAQSQEINEWVNSYLKINILTDVS